MSDFLDILEDHKNDRKLPGPKISDLKSFDIFSDISIYWYHRNILTFLDPFSDIVDQGHSRIPISRILRKLSDIFGFPLSEVSVTFRRKT